jgi:hypothetical protein
MGCTDPSPRVRFDPIAAGLVDTSSCFDPAEFLGQCDVDQDQIGRVCLANLEGGGAGRRDVQNAISESAGAVLSSIEHTMEE